MVSGKLKGAKYMVYWRSRVLLPDKVVREGVIRQVCEKGFCLELQQAVPLRSQLGLEFYIKYKGERCRIRAKTKVLCCTLSSSGQLAQLELQLIFTSQEERHTLNNALQILENSKTVDLRLP